MKTSTQLVSVIITLLLLASGCGLSKDELAMREIEDELAQIYVLLDSYEREALPLIYERRDNMRRQSELADEWIQHNRRTNATSRDWPGRREERQLERRQREIELRLMELGERRKELDRRNEDAEARLEVLKRRMGG
jgi:hypothetical protein